MAANYLPHVKGSDVRRRCFAHMVAYPMVTCPFGSAFGFIQPGDNFISRWRALRRQIQGTSPIKQYYLSVYMASGSVLTCPTAAFRPCALRMSAVNCGTTASGRISDWMLLISTRNFEAF